MERTDTYESPLSGRYASAEMQGLFSARHKFTTWRRLWIALARAEQKLGLPITDMQIAELERERDKIDFALAAEMEQKLRHDVMAHVHTYAQACPTAAPILHLGATSCYVGDNTDVIIMREALTLLRDKLVRVLRLLRAFALEYKDLPTLAYTHLQPAQLTTVGKRASLWLYDFLLDYDELTRRIDSLLLLGSKGTTGTQASFVELFEGDDEKVEALDRLCAAEMGFAGTVPVSGQTYSRKVDYQVLSALSGLAQSASKFSNDIRILQQFKEIEEPFEQSQIGSSAMPYKRNPMRCERISGLGRYVISNAQNGAMTASAQWFERTLDDSANRRLSIAEGFLCCDGILDILQNVCDGLVVYPRVIDARVRAELPFMATENIMMSAVKQGGDRQQLHELLRQLSQESARRVKEEGAANDLLERIAACPEFGLSAEELGELLNPKRYTGRAAAQVTAFIEGHIDPVLAQNKHIQIVKTRLKV